MVTRQPTAVLADDEPLLRADLAQLLAELWPQLQIVAQVSDGKAAVEAVQRLRPDVCFLDIHMPQMNGLDAAGMIKSLTNIVFVTAYDRYAARAFEQRALDYVVKPIEAARLSETVQRLRERLSDQALPGAAQINDQLTDLNALAQELKIALAQLKPPVQVSAETTSIEPLQWIKVVSGNSFKLLDVANVACFRAVSGYTQVLTREGEHLISEPLRDLIEKLDAKQFAQIHRATIVNLRFIAQVRRARPGHLLVELKHDLGTLEASRGKADVLRGL
jgi:DNA-binding LytR/AlgR family response regulator